MKHLSNNFFGGLLLYILFFQLNNGFTQDTSYVYFNNIKVFTNTQISLLKSVRDSLECQLKIYSPKYEISKFELGVSKPMSDLVISDSIDNFCFHLKKIFNDKEFTTIYLTLIPKNKKLEELYFILKFEY